jgi:phospholipase A2
MLTKNKFGDHSLGELVLKTNFGSKRLLLCLILGLQTSDTYTGLASVWQSVKTSVVNTTNNLIKKINAPSVVSALRYTQATNSDADLALQAIGNMMPAQNGAYSFNPRELANKLSRMSVSAAINYVLPIETTRKAWNVTQFVSHKVAHQFDPVLIPKFNEKNLFKRAPANLRLGLELPVEEQLTIDRRITYTKPALAKFLETNLGEKQNLRIGLCGSGGGYRAMLSTVGFLVGAQKIGLLDTVLYMSALSGSTWALGPWISMDLSINQFKNQLITKTKDTVSLAGKELLPPPGPAQLADVIFNLELKYLFHQPITSVDLWGAMIANKLFEPASNRQNVYLSNQRNIVADGKHIFPIYTAVNPGENLTYNWFEFTPFEVGSTNLQAFTPTWAFGRKFLNGKSVSSTTVAGDQYGPEQNLGYYLGIFGSAFTVNVEEFLDMMRQAEDTTSADYDSMELKVTVIEELAKNLAGIKDFRKARISPAKLYNYTYGLPQSPLKDEKQITLVDAGLAFNLPTPPLLRPQRALDIIFILDSSADIGSAGELKKAERYANQNNLPFPKINYDQAKTQAISVFRDKNDAKIPTIIYMPLIKDTSLPSIKTNRRFDDFDPKKCVEKDYCSTFNFKYEPEEFETLTLLTEINISDNSELIKKVFKDVLDLKAGQNSFIF